MKRLLRAALGLAVVLAAAGVARADVAATDDGGFKATGKTYSVVIDKAGSVRSLTVDGVEFLSDEPNKVTRFPAPGGAAFVELDGNRVVASRDNVRVVFQFDDKGFDLATEGGSIDWWFGKAVNAFVARNQQAVGPAGNLGDINLVIAGTAAVEIDRPFHLTYGRFWPSHLSRGGKPTDKFSCRFTCGVSFDPLQLLSAAPLEAGGFKPGVTPTYEANQPAHLSFKLSNLGAVELKGEVRFRLLDHPVNPKTAFEKTVPFTLAPNEANVVLSVDLPGQPAGPYWAKAAITEDGKAVRSVELGLLYDPNAYRPPLTRPADFQDFWQGKLKEMRAIPFDANLVEDPNLGDDRFIHYKLEITVAGGKRITTYLRVPRKEGQYDAEVHTYWGSNSQAQIMAELDKFEKQPVGAGMWQRGADRIRAGAPQPEDSTYTRWNANDPKNDNNLLDSYLMNVRMADYLRSLKNVKGIWLFGASRSGASMLAAACLSPEKVVAVNVHVPTCCGLSWADKPYAGWGKPPAKTPEGLAVAAYFDPVNFAPDLTVPVVMDGGMYDTLAPAPGILAFCNWADKSPLHRAALNLGGHGFFPSSLPREAMEMALSYYLHIPWPVPAPATKPAAKPATKP